jgi:cupin 2 domain-containing protein
VNIAAMPSDNLFDDIPRDLPEELTTTLHRAKNVRIERIVSKGQRSPDGFWYDQDEHEWVVVLEGAAIVEFQGDPVPVQLQRGSCLYIPAHKRHRVASTSAAERTIWLAIFYAETACPR